MSQPSTGDGDVFADAVDITTDGDAFDDATCYSNAYTDVSTPGDASASGDMGFWPV